MIIHCCLLDKDCRKVGAPARLHISTKTWNLGLALTPGSRFMLRKKKAPPYGPGTKVERKHYRNHWISVVRHPEGWKT